MSDFQLFNEAPCANDSMTLLREKNGQIGQEKPGAMPVDWPRQEEDDVLGGKSLLMVCSNIKEEDRQEPTYILKIPKP